MINTGTTIVTFLMVFLIQNTQNRDSHAIHAKLGEILLHIYGARNELMAAEDMSDEKMEELQKRFRDLAERGGVGVEERIRREQQRTAGSDSPQGRDKAAAS